MSNRYLKLEIVWKDETMLELQGIGKNTSNIK